MTLDSLLAVLRALDDAGVRYLIAGGVAVNLHGYVRATQDLDLVVGLESANAASVMSTLDGLGFRPQVPVSIGEFADPATRRHWIEDKHMQVFALISETYPDTTVDVFVTEPFDFDTEHAAADVYEIATDLRVRVVRTEALIAMKRAAGRPRDLDDVEHLEQILAERRGGVDGDG